MAVIKHELIALNRQGTEFVSHLMYPRHARGLARARAQRVRVRRCVLKATDAETLFKKSHLAIKQASAA